MLHDVASDVLHKRISDDLGVRYLSEATGEKGSSVGPAPWITLVHYQTSQDQRLYDGPEGPEYPSYNIVFLCVTGSPSTFYV